VSFATNTGTTDASGSFSTTVTPVTAGTVTVTVAGAGETRTATFTVTGVSASTFQITSPAASATAVAGTLGTPLTFTAAAPSPTTSVTFVSTLGTWNGSGSNVVTVTPSGGVASATLTATAAGLANVQVFDTNREATLSDARVVSFTAPCSAATKITLQTSPSVVSPNSSGTTSLSTLLATITDVNNNPVGNCPIAFSIVNPTGGGETISPAVVLTAAQPTSTTSLGQATSTFTSGSLPSSASGVKIHAAIIGTLIATGVAPSGADATIVIGGTAGSVTIGVSTVIGQDSTSTIYILPMSVLVSDSNGNPVANATVSLSAWPIAFNVGGATCVNSGGSPVPGPAGTFYFNEDVNENLTLDPGEDGVRRPYPNGTSSNTLTGTLDGQLTPPNSAAGTLPATVTTGSNGVATFNLTYTKTNSQWIVDRIRAHTLVQGTETLGETKFVLPALASDVSTCVLGATPYSF
jgi:hypothetical protein